MGKNLNRSEFSGAGDPSSAGAEGEEVVHHFWKKGSFIYMEKK